MNKVFLIAVLLLAGCGDDTYKFKPHTGVVVDKSFIQPARYDESGHYQFIIKDKDNHYLRGRVSPDEYMKAEINKTEFTLYLRDFELNQ